MFPPVFTVAVFALAVVALAVLTLHVAVAIVLPCHNMLVTMIFFLGLTTYSVMKGRGPVLDAVYEAHIAPAVVTGAVGALHCAAGADAEAVVLGRPLTQVM